MPSNTAFKGKVNSQMDLKNITLSEVSEKEKNQYSIHYHLYVESKKKKMKKIKNK